MSKIYAISSTGKTLKSFLDLRFGKCQNVVIFDADKKHHTIIENPFLGEEHSGTNLVDLLHKEGVTTIITGEIGPMVSEKLEKEKLQLVLLHEERIKIEEVIKRISR
ncbi:MAG: NifB/NifX family molybdenum-iron cluster-binding protein [Bacteroidota bacterium]